AEEPQVPNNNYSVLAINDLGMHCGDLDTRIASILPPFQVLLAQIVQKGADPVLNPAGVDVFYSAASNPNDPILNSNVFDGVMDNGDTYKTNFWSAAISGGIYNAFYPFDIDALMTDDLGLPVPNLETLYINNNGNVVPTPGGTGIIEAVQHAMPGIGNPYIDNTPQQLQEHFIDKPFFVSFPFGYVAADVNWYEGAGIPFSAFDDNGRENAYPLVRVQAVNGQNQVLSTVDTVLPISGEASCTNCHTTNDDYKSVHGIDNRTDIPTHEVAAVLDDPSTLDVVEGVATSLDDPDGNLPPKVSLEYAADINILRLHDIKHGADYVAPDGSDDPCSIDRANGVNGTASCLANKALEQGEPTVCQVCHYTPALDLAHVGPQAGLPGTDANGRNQLAHKSNSNVMHNHHGSITDLDRDGNPMFPDIDPPNQIASGAVTNQSTRVGQLEDSCYQCHPGTNVQCLRGAMFNADMLCSDCHATMLHVGNDFSNNVSPSNPGAFVLNQGNFYDPASSQPRVPWANEPGCGSCHTGDANNNLAGTAGTMVNTADTNGNTDGIRLRMAYRVDNQGDPADAKATPIVPTNKRFAEPAVPASFNGFTNPGAGNPQLYRVSTGHGGVMCEGCHGATHAEWPNANPSSNDNITANQLQGHTGVIIECSTCHGAAMNNSNTINGPHGMHPVGDNTSFANGGHEHVDRSGCSDCHGPGGRSSNVGTVLSVARADRNLRGTLVNAGEPVGCSICHGGGGDD
ncbi:MAG: cytochrome C, partial [Gammaproteobacteria bacterium]